MTVEAMTPRVAAERQDVDRLKFISDELELMIYFGPESSVGRRRITSAALWQICECGAQVVLASDSHYGATAEQVIEAFWGNGGYSPMKCHC